MPKHYFCWQTSIKTSRLIKYLAIDHTTKWCIREQCKIMRRFASSFPICNMVKIHQSAVKNMWKNDNVYLLSKSSSANFYHITNERMGGESSYNFASLYTSPTGVINCQIPRSFDWDLLKWLASIFLGTLLNFHCIAN